MSTPRDLLALVPALALACGSASGGSPECADDDPICVLEPADPDAEPTPVEDGLAPTIMSVTPTHRSEGIAPGQPVVIQFSEPMSPESTVASVSISPAMPLLSHEWNQGFDQLTLFFPFTDAEADYPELPGVNEYTVSISIVAEDSTGNELGEGLEISFSTRRFQRHHFAPVGALSGHTTNPVTTHYSFVGAGDYSGRRWHGYLSFDISEFPSALRGDVESALIDSHLRIVQGDPFARFGSLHLAHASFDSRNEAATTPALREVGILIPADPAPEPKAQYLLDVTAAFADDVNNRVSREDHSQYLLTFPNAPADLSSGYTWLYTNPDRAAEQGVPNTELTVRTRFTAL